jgi:hypothetical protein
MLGAKSQQRKYLSIGDKERGKTERPWALFQETWTGKARLSYKQALHLWSGFVEFRMPTALNKHKHHKENFKNGWHVTKVAPRGRSA